MWVENDVMYIGYYSGGARVVDVSGELRGNLYRQGREMARLWTGDAKGFRPNIPFAWGAQPHDGLIYFNDIHTGIWATKDGRSSRTRHTEALTVDGPQDVDASSLWTDIDAAHHRQGPEVENLDRARLGRNALYGDERVAVIG